MRVEAFLDLQRKGSGEIAEGRVEKGGEGVGRSGPQRDLNRTPEGMRVVRRVITEKRKKKTERLNDGAEMKEGEGDTSHL